MTVALLIALVAVIGLHVWDRRHARETVAAERRHAREIEAAERASWRNERGALLNRIKPETAQPVYDETPDEPMPQPATNEKDWWEQLQELRQFEATFTEPVG